MRPGPRPPPGRSGSRVCTSTTPPSARGPTMRAARTSNHSACSAARYRGASSSWSKSRNATSRTGRAGSWRTRWSTASVPTATSNAGSGALAVSIATTCARGTNREICSRMPVTPARSVRNDPEPQCVHTADAAVSQRGHASPSPESASGPPHREHSTSSRHTEHASKRAFPRRFSTQSARPRSASAAWSAAVSDPDSRCSPGAWSRRSTTSRRGQPARSRARSTAAVRSAPAMASTLGIGLTMSKRAPTRRARSAARSRACHDGDRSSLSASSASSRMTKAARSGTGASTATRPPMTTHAPCRARSHARVRSAAGWSPRSTST